MEGWDDFFPEFGAPSSSVTPSPALLAPVTSVPAVSSSSPIPTKPPPIPVSPLTTTTLSTSTPTKPPPPPLALTNPDQVSESETSLVSVLAPSHSTTAAPILSRPPSSPRSSVPPTFASSISLSSTTSERQAESSDRIECERLTRELRQRDEELAQLKAEMQALRDQNATLQASLQSGVDAKALQARVDALSVELLTQQATLNDALSLTWVSDVTEARIDSKVNPPCSGVSVHFLVTPPPPDGSTVQWFRSFAGSLFEKIEGATQPLYVPTADDIGAVLKGRVSGVEGVYAEAETGPVMVKKDVAEKLVEFLKKGAFNLDVDPSAQGGPSSLLVTKKNLKLKVGRKTDLLGELGPGLRVDLVQGDKFCVKSPHWNAEHTFTAPKESRDLYVLGLRLLNAHAPEHEHDNSMRWQIVQLNAAKLQGLAQDSQALRAYTSAEFEKKWETIRKVLGGGGPSVRAPAGPVRSLASERKDVEFSRKTDELKKIKDEEPKKLNIEERKLEDKEPHKEIIKEPERKPKEIEQELPEVKTAPRELKYDAEGFLIVDETERGFSSYESSKHNSDSDDEQEKKPHFKLAIRPAGAPAPTTNKAIPVLARPESLTLPKKKKEEKKTLKRGQTLPPTPLVELAENGWAGVDAFPKMQMDAFHEVRFMMNEIVNAKIREGSVELLDIRGELHLNRVGSSLMQTTVPFGFKGPVKKILANEPSVSGEAGNYNAKFSENQDTLCALKYVVDCDGRDARLTLPLLAKVIWDCRPGETIVEVNFDINPKYKDALSGIKFLFNVLPPSSVSKCVLPKGLCKAQGLWNPKTQQLMWKLPPASDKGRLLFRLTTTVITVPSQMDVFFAGDLDESLAGIMVDVASSDSLQIRKTHSVKAGMYSVFPSVA